MKRLFCIYTFLMLNSEPADMWYKLWETPMVYPSILLVGLPIAKLQIHQWFLVIMAAVSAKPRPKDIAKPVPTSLKLCFAGLVGSLAWGILSGGADTMQGLFQIMQCLNGLLIAYVVMRIFRTPEDFYTLGKTIVLAGIYRSVMCILFYWFVIKARNIDPMPETMTTHSDTTLFVTTLLGIIAYVFEEKTKKARRFAYWSVPIVILAIQFNNRRLAWVSLAMALIVLYFVYPAGEVKKRINKQLKRYAPIILAYLMAAKVAVDGGSQSPVFKPVAALVSSGDKNNPSTRSRLAENMGLLVTFMPNIWLGTGFGHEYIEVDSTLSAGTVFAQYKYVPHNSLLGFVAFCGVAGFFLIWTPLPVCVLLAARAYRLATKPNVRVLTALSVAECCIFASQCFGDMGFFNLVPWLLQGTACAIAARLAVERPPETGLAHA